MLEYHNSVEKILMGCRRTDPGMEKASTFSKSDNGYPSFIRVFPLLDWDNQMIWSFIFDHSLDFPSLYCAGFSSIGTRANTSINPKLLTVNGLLPAWELKSDDNDRAGRDGFNKL